MSASYDVKLYKAHFQSSIESFKLMMDTFHNSLEEVCFSLHDNVLDVRSHFDEENGRKMLNTKVSILCQDFQLYNTTTKEKLDMILSFKDLKPFLQFADLTFVPIDCYLSDNESPVIFTISIQNQDNVTDFEGELILATQAPNKSSTQISQSTSSPNINSSSSKLATDTSKISTYSTPEKRKRQSNDDQKESLIQEKVFKTPDQLFTTM